jgi:uncharacterized membrane protein
MPYYWTYPSQNQVQLQLQPHNALSAKGFAWVILGFYLLAGLPFVFLAGTGVFWGLLPFMLLALGALAYALRRNARDRSTTEVLLLDPKHTRLTRRNPNGQTQEWECNSHWVTVALYPTKGPVPDYVTLKGSGREVEIGAFLSQDERKTLYAELEQELQRIRGI